MSVSFSSSGVRSNITSSGKPSLMILCRTEFLNQSPQLTPCLFPAKHLAQAVTCLFDHFLAHCLALPTRTEVLKSRDQKINEYKQQLRALQNTIIQTIILQQIRKPRMDKFLKTHDLPRLNYEEIKNLNRLITSNEIESVI